MSLYERLRARELAISNCTQQSILDGGAAQRALCSRFVPASTVQLISASSSVFNMSFSPDGSVLVCANEDRSVRGIDPRTRTVVFNSTGHREAVNIVKFVDDYCFFTGSDDGAVRQMDLRRIKHDECKASGSGSSGGGSGSVATYHAHEGWVKNIELVSGGRMLTSSFDGTVRLWNIDDSKRSQEIMREPNVVRFRVLPDERTAVFTLRNNLSFLIHDFDAAALAEQPLQQLESKALQFAANSLHRRSMTAWRDAGAGAGYGAATLHHVPASVASAPDKWEDLALNSLADLVLIPEAFVRGANRLELLWEPEAMFNTTIQLPRCRGGASPWRFSPLASDPRAEHAAGLVMLRGQRASQDDVTTLIDTARPAAVVDAVRAALSHELDRDAAKAERKRDVAPVLAGSGSGDGGSGTGRIGSSGAEHKADSKRSESLAALAASALPLSSFLSASPAASADWKRGVRERKAGKTPPKSLVEALTVLSATTFQLSQSAVSSIIGRARAGTLQGQAGLSATASATAAATGSGDDGDDAEDDEEEEDNLDFKTGSGSSGGSSSGGSGGSSGPRSVAFLQAMLAAFDRVRGREFTGRGAPVSRAAGFDRRFLAQLPVTVCEFWHEIPHRSLPVAAFRDIVLEHGGGCEDEERLFASSARRSTLSKAAAALSGDDNGGAGSATAASAALDSSGAGSGDGTAAVDDDAVNDDDVFGGDASDLFGGFEGDDGFDVFAEDDDDEDEDGASSARRRARPVEPCAPVFFPNRLAMLFDEAPETAGPQDREAAGVIRGTDFSSCGGFIASPFRRGLRVLRVPRDVSRPVTYMYAARTARARAPDAAAVESKASAAAAGDDRTPLRHRRQWQQHPSSGLQAAAVHVVAHVDDAHARTSLTVRWHPLHADSIVTGAMSGSVRFFDAQL